MVWRQSSTLSFSTMNVSIEGGSFCAICEGRLRLTRKLGWRSLKHRVRLSPTPSSLSSRVQRNGVLAPWSVVHLGAFVIFPSTHIWPALTRTIAQWKLGTSVFHRKRTAHFTSTFVPKERFMMNNEGCETCKNRTVSYRTVKSFRMKYTTRQDKPEIFPLQDKMPRLPVLWKIPQLCKTRWNF